MVEKTATGFKIVHKVLIVTSKNKFVFRIFMDGQEKQSDYVYQYEYVKH